jgi:hypothetical protein
VLSDSIDLVQRNPGPPALGLILGVVVGFAVGWAAFSMNGETPVQVTPGGAVRAQPTPAGAQASVLDAKTLEHALDTGVKAVREQGGTAQAAVAIDGERPVIAGEETEIPAGSLVRAAVALAASGSVDDALLAKSIGDPSGCWNRIVLSKLGGSAMPDVYSILGRVGATTIAFAGDADVGPCAGTFKSQGVQAAPALDAAWTIGSAAAFAQDLATDQSNARLLDWTRESGPKWGAVDALKPYAPFVLTGWTTDRQDPMTVSQIAVMHVGDHVVSAAVAFHPKSAKARDASTSGAPAALRALLGPLAAQLPALQKAGK